MGDSVELLAPAGNFDTALAAFEAGADAVYCGLTEFSARAFADNFGIEELKQLLRYCRSWRSGTDTPARASLRDTAAQWGICHPYLAVDRAVFLISGKDSPRIAPASQLAHSRSGDMLLRSFGWFYAVMARV